MLIVVTGPGVEVTGQYKDWQKGFQGRGCMEVAGYHHCKAAD